MKGIGVGCGVVCDEFNVLLVKIFIILIVSEDYIQVRTKEFFFVGCVVVFIVAMVFDVWDSLFVVISEPAD